MNISKIIKDIFTGKDNKTYDIGRVLWFKASCSFVILTAFSIYKGGILDPIAWGTGMAAILGAGGAALGLKASTEPLIDVDKDGIDDRYQPRRDRIPDGRTHIDERLPQDEPVIE